MAARSFHIRLINTTSYQLTRTSLKTTHGIWGDDNSRVPPTQLAPGHATSWDNESDGLGTGVEGEVIYSTSAGTITISWDNPFIGSNGFYVGVPAGIQRTYGDISGNDAAVEITLFGDIIDD